MIHLENLREIALQLPQTTEDIKWENHLCFNIGGKMYLITSPDSQPVSASFKTSDNDFEELTSREGIIPAPYMARYKWVQVDDLRRLNQSEWEKYIRSSYQLIFSKLSGKLKKEIKS